MTTERSVKLQRICGNCNNFTPLNPDDETAPEGKCNLPNRPACWPMGYWPAMLRQDFCGKFVKTSITNMGAA